MTGTLEDHRSIDDLGPEWDAVFAAGSSVQCSRAWFAASAEAALPEGAEARFLAFRERGVPVALLPMRAGPGRRWRSLTTPYTCLFQPLLARTAGPDAFQRAAQCFGRYLRARCPVTVLEALDPAWEGLAPFRAGFGEAGLVTRSFAHFGNWHEQVPGSWAAYLEGRPGQLRTTASRKGRAAARDWALRLEFLHAPEALGAALAAYEEVYRRSWKQPEPFPAFNATLVRLLGEAGVLRFGLMWAEERPIAAQYWTVSGGQATVLKLAHDDAFKPVSPGTVLTAHVIRNLIEGEGVREIDFGRGDDPYKQGWARERRQRIGLLAFDAATFPGGLALLRHEMARIFRSAQNCLKRDPG